MYMYMMSEEYCTCSETVYHGYPTCISTGPQTHYILLGACRACLGRASDLCICKFFGDSTIGNYNSTLWWHAGPKSMWQPFYYLWCIDVTYPYQWSKISWKVGEPLRWKMLDRKPFFILHKIKHVTNSWDYSLLGGPLPILTSFS